MSTYITGSRYGVKLPFAAASSFVIAGLAGASGKNQSINRVILGHVFESSEFRTTPGHIIKAIPPYIPSCMLSVGDKLWAVGPVCIAYRMSHW